MDEIDSDQAAPKKEYTAVGGTVILRGGFLPRRIRFARKRQILSFGFAQDRQLDTTPLPMTCLLSLPGLCPDGALETQNDSSWHSLNVEIA